MVNPQKENGYIPTSREINHALISITLSDYERRVIGAIFDKTYGWNKKEDWISNTQISELTGIAKPHVSRTIKKLLDKNMIYRNGKVIGFQKYYDKWKIVPKKVVEKYKQKLPKQVSKVTQTGNEKPSGQQTKVTQTGIKSYLNRYQELPKQVSTEASITKASIQKQNIYSIFEHWNNSKIIVHKKNTYESRIRSALKDYKLEKILTAITNYATIVNNDDYYFSYKWTLGDFLKRGIDKFLDLEIAKNNYRKEKNGKFQRSDKRPAIGEPEGDKYSHLYNEA